MIYIIALLAVLFEIAWRPALRIWEGSVYLLPVLLLVFAGAGDLRRWLVGCIAAVVVSFFVPLPILTYWLPLLILSLVQYWVFRVWIHPDTQGLKTAITGLILTIFIAISLAPVSIMRPSVLVGSVLLSVPLVAAWYWWQGYTRRGM